MKVSSSRDMRNYRIILLDGEFLLFDGDFSAPNGGTGRLLRLKRIRIGRIRIVALRLKGIRRIRRICFGRVERRRLRRLLLERVKRAACLLRRLRRGGRARRTALIRRAKWITLG